MDSCLSLEAKLTQTFQTVFSMYKYLVIGYLFIKTEEEDGWFDPVNLAMFLKFRYSLTLCKRTVIDESWNANLSLSLLMFHVYTNGVCGVV